jgi:phosphatidylcholine synthase
LLVSSRNKAFAIHFLTASGAFAGLLALEAAVHDHIRAALLWLIICQLLDGFDGPIARKFNVESHAPTIDGHILDLIVDYVTCAVVPVALLIQLNLLPHQREMWLGALIILTGAIWFARTDQETEDFWFNGFPAAWNLIVPSLIILDTGTKTSEFIIISLSILSLTKVKFPHLLRVVFMRKVTIFVCLIYFISLTVLSAKYPDGPRFLEPVLYLVPIYIAGLSFIRSFKKD